MCDEERAKRLVDLHLAANAEANRIASSILLRGEDSVLLWLHRHGGSANASQLAEDTHLTSGRIANILRRLESKGYVQRRQDTDDHRRVSVGITERGKDRVMAVYQRLLGYSKRLLQEMGTSDFDQLCHSLAQVYGIIGHKAGSY